MIKYVSLVFILSLSLLMGGCASKRYFKKALKYEQAGLYSNAADLYYSSLAANNNNIEARIGFQRTGQMVLEDRIKVFKSKYKSGTTKEAVYAFREADAYHKKAESVGVKLLLPQEQRVYYQEVEDKYLNNIYQDASKALELVQYGAAETLFAEILAINQTYKDSKSKWVIAKYEPIYQQGNNYLSAKQYRSAYYRFDEVVRGASAYKNSIEQRETALRNATLSIAIAPVGLSDKSDKSTGEQLKTMMANEINQIKAPFYKVIDDQSIRSVSYWRSVSSPELAVQLAKRQGSRFEAKAVFTMSIDRYNRTIAAATKTEKHGYVKRNTTVVDKATNTTSQKVVYDKVVYYEYTQESKVHFTLEYKLFRIDQNELAVSSRFGDEEISKVHYASFDGDDKALIAGYWVSKDKSSPDDKIYETGQAAKELQALLAAPKTMLSLTELENKLFARCVNQMATQIENYKPEN